MGESPPRGWQVCEEVISESGTLWLEFQFTILAARLLVSAFKGGSFVE